METTFFYVIVSIAFHASFVEANSADKGPLITTNTTTILNTKDGEIAHFTCTSRGHSMLSVTWEKEDTKLEDGSSGVVIISWKNGTITESHLLVAVTCDERRGQYTCVASSQDGETRQTFVIEGQAKRELQVIDYIAIGVGIGVTLSLFTAIAFFMIRGSRRLKEGKLVAAPGLAVNGQNNEALEEESSNAELAL